MDRLKQAADERRAARAAMPDVAAFGQLVRRDRWTKTFRRVDGDVVTGTLLTRGGSALSVVGICLDCVTGATDCCAPAADEQPEQQQPADEQPPAAPGCPQPARNHQPGTSPAPEQPPAAPRLDPNLAALAVARWSKDPGGRGTAL